MGSEARCLEVRGEPAANVLLLGKGTVGSQVLAQLHKLSLSGRGDALSLAGLADSHRALFDERGIDLSRWRPDLVEAQASAPSLQRMEFLLGRLAKLESPILVDCTAAEGMEASYALAFERGVSVVAANKKPFAIEWGAREQLFALACEHGCSLRYETTVGAALPVLGPLQDLVKTGDQVSRIEASLSGTLNYLCCELMRGVPLSQAVQRALELGYTEPHPRDDLSGLDVARKALILARELELPLSLSDVQLTPFVDARALEAPDAKSLIAKLRGLDAVFAAEVEAHRSQGAVLRYLASVDPSNAHAIRVGPQWIEASHPAAGLQASEALVAIWSERYAQVPLRVQGPGAGAAVTASGVLADVLRIAAQH